jgi:aquaporin Z
MVDIIALVAEFFGTFLLVLTILVSGGSAFWIGLSLAIIVALIGNVSGAHVNPAVSAAMYLKGSLSLQSLAAYAFSQIAGGVSCFYAFKYVS